MNELKYKVICWTSRGYECFTGLYASLKKAKEVAKQLIEDGVAFSYNIYMVGEK